MNTKKCHVTTCKSQTLMPAYRVFYDSTCKSCESGWSCNMHRYGYFYICPNTMNHVCRGKNIHYYYRSLISAPRIIGGYLFNVPSPIFRIGNDYVNFDALNWHWYKHSHSDMYTQVTSYNDNMLQMLTPNTLLNTLKKDTLMYFGILPMDINNIIDEFLYLPG